MIITSQIEKKCKIFEKELNMKLEKTDKEDIVNPTKVEDVAEENAVEKVGDMIRNARNKKKIDLPKVAAELCIRKVYLEAIETSDYEAMPEHPYGIGFVRSYAEFLGLSSSRMADLYRTELNIKDSQNKAYAKEDADLESNVPSRKYLIISIIAVVLLYVAWLFIDKYTSDFDEENVVAEVVADAPKIDGFPLQIEDFTTPDSATVVENSGVIEVVDLTNQQGLSTEKDVQVNVDNGNYVDGENKTIQEKVVASEEKNIEFKIVKRSWFEVKDEKKIYVSRIFDAGATYTMPKDKGLVVSVGIPSAVDVYIDGKLVKDVFTSRKKTNIDLDKFLDQKEH